MKSTDQLYLQNGSGSLRSGVPAEPSLLPVLYVLRRLLRSLRPFGGPTDTLRR